MSEIMDQSHQGYTQQISRDFFRSVYTYMFLALGISGGIAYLIGAGPQTIVNGQELPKLFLDIFMNPDGSISFMFYVIVFAPILLGLGIQSAFMRMPMWMLLTLYIVYAGLMGMSLSSIFIIYSMGAIASTFFVAAGAFGAMAIMGYTTSTDLTKMGSLLYMVFIGMFIAIAVNWFIGSDSLDYVISIIGVFVFTGLTAYYMQQLKTISQDPTFSALERNKISLVGGLQLYILFVNLFLVLLRLLGGGRD
jgi:FtsH-binding integral membrane protein